MHVPRAVTRQSQINDVVAEIERELAGDVVHIRYSIDTDWSGDWAIFFRVVLTDAASRGRRLKLAASKVRAALSDRLKPLDLGLIVYSNFRSQSELVALPEEAWV